MEDETFVNEAETPVKKSNPCVWVGLGAMAACAALIVTAALALPKANPDREVEEGPAAPENNAGTNSEMVELDGRIVPGGKYVTSRLWEALQGTDGAVAMTAEVWNVDWNYVYEGHTLSELQQLCVEETMRAFKMEELLKEGDYLKYGEALCTTGAPDGTRYAREFYEERTAYYGERTAYYGELLDKYIVDGEFLQEDVERDLLEPERFYEEMYDRAMSAYKSDRVSTLCRRISELGIAYTLSEDGTLVFMTVTPAEFEDIDLTDISGTAQVPREFCYKFTLAGDKDDFPGPTDMPLPE